MPITYLTTKTGVRFPVYSSTDATQVTQLYVADHASSYGIDAQTALLMRENISKPVLESKGEKSNENIGMDNVTLMVTRSMAITRVHELQLAQRNKVHREWSIGLSIAFLLFSLYLLWRLNIGNIQSYFKNNNTVLPAHMRDFWT